MSALDFPCPRCAAVHLHGATQEVPPVGVARVAPTGVASPASSPEHGDVWGEGIVEPGEAWNN